MVNLPFTWVFGFRRGWDDSEEKGPVPSEKLLSLSHYFSLVCNKIPFNHGTTPEWRYPVRWCISLVSINKCFHSNINFQCKITSISSLRLRKLIIPTAYVTSSLASDNLQAYVLQGSKKLQLIFDLKLPSQSNLITRWSNLMSILLIT